MQLFRFSPCQEFYLLRFVQEEPVWEYCSSQGRKVFEGTFKDTGLPVLALIPDRFFFFHLPQSLAAKSRKKMRTAAELQLRHMFPSPEHGQELGVLDTGFDILGYFRSAEISSFLERHAHILARANTVSTPFLLTRAVCIAQSKSCWSMHNSGDPLILVQDNHLQYFRGDEQELKNRIADSETNQEISSLLLDDVLSALYRLNLSWNRFRLQLKELEQESREIKIIFRVAAALLVAGILFCAGEYLKLRADRDLHQQWATALQTLYVETLGQDYGPDPYGQLLYQADLSRHSHAQGLDFLDFLGRLSQAAPADLQLESLSLGRDSGTLRAYTGSYEQMEQFLRTLKAGEQYDFVLDQADSSEGQVRLTLRVSY